MIIQKLPNGIGQVRLSDDLIKNLKDALSIKYKTQVGILGSKATGRRETVAIKSGKNKGKHKAGKVESDQTNAEIGLIHEKGIKTGNNPIPRRSFLEIPILNNAKEIFEKKKALENQIKLAILSGKDFNQAWKQAYKDLGFFAEAVVQRSFEESGPGWPPNAESTIRRKKSSKPLIDTGQLRRSISSRVVTL
jgi:hypothetical protein